MKKSCLVLEGGGLRGVFTAGVTDFFLDREIYFDSCIAVSAGACHASSYLARQRGRAFSVTADYLDDPDFMSMRNLLKKGELFGSEMLYDKIPRELYPIDNAAFKASEAEFYATITNCETGEAEYHKINHLVDDIDIVKASASLPLLANMTKIGDFHYLDGGVADSIPLEKALELGCEKIVVVLTREGSFVIRPSSAAKAVRRHYRDFPRLAETLEKRHLIYNETLAKIEELEKSGRIFVIRPERKLKLSTVEKNKKKLRSVYNYGYECAENQADELLKYLNR